MVDTIRSSARSLPLRNASYKAVSSAPAVSPSGDKEQQQRVWQKPDRRKNKDRRCQHSSKHPKFEMRRNRGRRKDDRTQPVIETRV